MLAESLGRAHQEELGAAPQLDHRAQHGISEEHRSVAAAFEIRPGLLELAELAIGESQSVVDAVGRRLGGESALEILDGSCRPTAGRRRLAETIEGRRRGRVSRQDAFEELRRRVDLRQLEANLSEPDQSLRMIGLELESFAQAIHGLFEPSLNLREIPQKIGPAGVRGPQSVSVVEAGFRGFEKAVGQVDQAELAVGLTERGRSAGGGETLDGAPLVGNLLTDGVVGSLEVRFGNLEQVGQGRRVGFFRGARRTSGEREDQREKSGEPWRRGVHGGYSTGAPLPCRRT